MYSRRNVFYVGYLSLSGFDKVSEAMRETGTSLTEKAEQERKKLQNVYTSVLCVLSCITKWRERECAVFGS